MRRAEQTEQLLQAKLVEEEAARRQQAKLQVPATRALRPLTRPTDPLN
eukprot:COSAG01_NODE_2851_length_6937_cov_13.682228_10_plen_48_part_00